MAGRTFKRCNCHGPDGKRLGTACPKLRRRNGAWSSEHGTWWYQIELPHRADATRRQVRHGGLPTSTDADHHINKITALLAVADERDTTTRTLIGDIIEAADRARKPLPTPEELRHRLATGGQTDPWAMPTVGEWLDTWLAGRKTIRRSTVRCYTSHIRLWLKPHLGHHRLDTLSIAHVDRMFDAIAERNELIEAARASDDPAVRASVYGMRLIGAATMQRYRATLRAALNAAIRARRSTSSIPLITFNPASWVELPSGKRPKALLWTDERVAQWHNTGHKPSRVMVWTPTQMGAFLDHAADDPLYPLFHLIAYRGLRRGEACGLPWSETNLTTKTITISSQLVQVGWAAEFGEPKSDASGRVVALDTDTAGVLRAHRDRQAEDRALLGDAWVDSGLVFTDLDGSPLHPAKVTDRFYALAAEAGLPPIRLHDLRHAAATLTLATGADLKVVQELLGHSSITITADTYTHVLPELARETAEAAARLVPRRGTTA